MSINNTHFCRLKTFSGQSWQFCIYHPRHPTSKKLKYAIKKNYIILGWDMNINSVH